MAAPHKPKRTNVAPPSGAATFALFSVTTTRTESAEGKRYSRSKSKKLHGPAAEDGTLPDMWPIEEFSTRFVVDGWGAGSYRVDWYGVDGQRLSSDSFKLDTPPSVARKRAAQAHAVEGEDAAPMAAGAFRIPTTPIEMLMWQRQEEREAAAIRREEARDEDRRREAQYERQAERDRNWQTQLLQIVAGARSEPQANGELLR